MYNSSTIHLLYTGWLNELGRWIYKPITNTAWVRTRFVNYKNRCTRLAVASDKVYLLVAHGRWFSPGSPSSSTTKAGCHDLAQILLKVALKHHKSNQSNQSIYCIILVLYIYYTILVLYIYCTILVLYIDCTILVLYIYCTILELYIYCTILVLYIYFTILVLYIYCTILVLLF